MPDDNRSTPASSPSAEDPARASRHLVRAALKATLATLDRQTGHPYASLVLVATEPDGTPVLIVSRLALHTQNLERDARASLLIDGTDGPGDPLSGARVTLIGEMRPTTSATARRRFLERHPAARGYAGFADFSVYALELARAHYVGGFGRIVGLAAADLKIDVENAGPLVEAEADIIAHMNSDHADAVALYAAELAGRPDGAWVMSGIDPEGIDLLHRTNSARVPFAAPVRTPGEARNALAAMARRARARRSGVHP